jgi:hypothetical protein
LNPPDTGRRALRHHDNETVFTEQWHAQVIALLDLLVAQGKIIPSEWSQALGAELDRRASAGMPDSDDNYYDAFLTVLERTLGKAELVVPSEVNKREADWREAYLSTPHGQPVVLKS